MTPANEAWLRLTTEETIDPELPICDPHHHLWDRPGDRYLPEELLRDTGTGHNMWNAFKRITHDFSPAERAALFHDTAAHVYRLQ